LIIERVDHGAENSFASSACHMELLLSVECYSYATAHTPLLQIDNKDIISDAEDDES